MPFSRRRFPCPRSLPPARVPRATPSAASDRSSGQCGATRTSDSRASTGKFPRNPDVSANHMARSYASGSPRTVRGTGNRLS
ncbi:hypothetical protein LI90_2635 [Carbonactinospora thermoautotrophica]|uniref:Uncharacterized protein n=1 Tax=Carbonactinospora thermoautotrophica TaxID=1469144 RepID=A0A132MUT3_9ACTN|nr:hypothetical protein LI90_2635 [Carbonactinospora thermoautotrophica]